MIVGMSTTCFEQLIKRSGRILVYSISLFWLISSNVQAQSWVQIGRTIDASHSDFSSGNGVSLDSSGTQLVMASLEIMSHQSRHLAKCYSLQSTEKTELVTGSEGTNVVTTVELEWSQKKELIWLDNLDQSVTNIDQDAKGHLVMFGFGDGLDSGSVVAYGWQGYNPGWGKPQWNKKGQSLALKEGSFVDFATAISASGRILGISSLNGWAKDKNNSGSIQLYEFKDEDWRRKGKAIGADSGMYWASEVSLSRDGSIVGAYGYDYNRNIHFRIHEFREGIWEIMGSDISLDLGFKNAKPSIDMSSDGNIAVLGISKHRVDGEAIGEVRTYRYSNESWEQLGQVVSTTTYKEDFGKLVQLSADGRRLAVLSTLPLEEMKTRLRIRMYKLEGDLWVQVANSIDYDGWDGDPNVSISMDSKGERIAIGSTFTDIGHDSKIRVYGWSETDEPPAPSIDPERPEVHIMVAQDATQQIPKVEDKKVCWIKRIFGKKK